MMAPKIFGIVALIVALGLVVYIFQSGIIGRVGSLGFFSSGSSTTSHWFSYGTSTHNYQNSPSPWFISAPPEQSGTGNTAPPQPSGAVVNPSDVPSGFTLSQLSSYFRKVRIGSVSPGSIYSYGQVSLYANFSAGESVNVTGWRFQANEGGQFVPKAVNVYDPSGLTAPSDIYLGSGDFVNIYTSQSAIGENLRLNKCIGYLENSNKFTPSLPLDCPYVNRSEISNFSGTCQDYISSLGGCRLPSPNPPIPENDYGCRHYLDTINYKGCYNKYLGDADFSKHEIRAWSGSRFLDERHDRVLLLDRNGLLVDLYEY